MKRKTKKELKEERRKIHKQIDNLKQKDYRTKDENEKLSQLILKDTDLENNIYNRFYRE